MTKYVPKKLMGVMMSLKTRFYNYKRALLALMVISLFTGSSYLSVLTFSQNSTNYLANLLTNYLPTNSVNAKEYPIGWQQGSGTIEVIEKYGSRYFVFNDDWQYRYVDDGKIQARINHTLNNHWQSGWTYYKSHAISGSSAGALTNYQMRIVVHYGSGTDSGENVYCNNHCRIDFGDIRFTKSDWTTLLDYWMESKTDGDKATFWVKVDYIPPSPDTEIIYVYYGNAGASTTSNGTNTFEFFDDFNTLNTSIWNSTDLVYDAYSGWTIENGNLVLYVGTRGTYKVWAVDQYVRTNDYYDLNNRVFEINTNMSMGGTVYDPNKKCEESGIGFQFFTPGDAQERFYCRQECTDDWLRYTGIVAPYAVLWNEPSWNGSPTGYYVLGLSLSGNVTRLYENMVLQTTYNDNLASDNVKLCLITLPAYYRGNGWGEQSIDWARIRNLANPEPTHEAWGSEEVCIPYLLVGYEGGWNFNSTSNGTLVPNKDPIMWNYYWIQSPTGTVTITFDVDQLYTYDGIKIVTGNEPFSDFPSGQSVLTNDGNSFKFNPKQTTFVYDLYPSYSQFTGWKRECYSTTDPSTANTLLSSDEITLINSSDNNRLQLFTPGYSVECNYLKFQWNLSDIENSVYQVTRIDWNYEGWAKSLGSYTIEHRDLWYRTDNGWVKWKDFGSSEATHVYSTSDRSQILNLMDDSQCVFFGARSYCNWFPNLWGVQSWNQLFCDFTKLHIEYQNQYSSLTYDCPSFNTNDQPWLLVKYRTSDSTDWNLYLTNGSNNKAQPISLKGTPTPNYWNVTKFYVNDGNSYDGFYLQSSDWGKWIEFDYVLTGREIEVNSFDPSLLPYLEVGGTIVNGSFPLGTPANQLYVAGNIREKDGYGNPIVSNRLCEIQLWKQGAQNPIYPEPGQGPQYVTGDFIHNITIEGGLGPGYYTVKIKPYWPNPRYNDVEWYFSVYPLKCTGWFKEEEDNITVYEKFGLNYNQKNTSWYYRYTPNGIETVINYIINEPIDYLILGYKDGWELNTDLLEGGVLRPCQDSIHTNYYWIEPFALSVTIHFEVNQTYEYAPFNIITFNEYMDYFNSLGSVTRNGDTVKFQSTKQYIYVLLNATTGSTIFNSWHGEKCPSVFDFWSNPEPASNQHTDSEKNKMRTSDNAYYTHSFANVIRAQLANKFRWDVGTWENQEFEILNFTYIYEGYFDRSIQTAYEASRYVKNSRGIWENVGTLTPSDSLTKWSTTQPDSYIIDAYSRPYIMAGSFVNGYLPLGPVENPAIFSISESTDYVALELWSQNRYSYLWLYSPTSFSTAEYPNCLVRYRTSDATTNWEIGFGNSSSITQNDLTLLATNGVWVETELTFTKDFECNYFRVNNNTNWGEWIEFDYILPCRIVEVNSLNPSGNPNLTVSVDNSSQPIGLANPLKISGTIREMDGYQNPISDLSCTLEIQKEGQYWNNYLVNRAFELSFNSLDDGLYTIKIEPYWKHPSYYNVELNFSAYQGKLNTVFYDTQAPNVEITKPPSDEDTVNYDVIWVNGTYYDTENPVTKITINDERFTLVEPKHPYGYSGYFSFRAEHILMSEFDVEVTVQDRWANINTKMRHINVTDADYPIVKITSPDRDDTYVIGSSVSILGTYNGTGSQITDITIDVTEPYNLIRVTPEPDKPGPYNETGFFEFRIEGIKSDTQFDVKVTVVDQAHLESATIRHVNVVLAFTEYFNVESNAGGSETLLQAKIYTKNPGTRQPLIVLVHGLASNLKGWEGTFSFMLQRLIRENYTVVAYTQRPGVSTVGNVGSFKYLIQDLYYVIDTAVKKYGSDIDETSIGLVGHSLGSWVVTMAASILVPFLGEYQSSLKIVVEGDGPDNLYDAAIYLCSQYGITWWYDMNREALQFAQYFSPIGPGKNWYQACMDWWDFCDFITVPFCAVDNIVDILPPLDNFLPLYLDIAWQIIPTSYGPIAWLCNPHVHGTIVADCLPHQSWASPTAVNFAVAIINAYM